MGREGGEGREGGCEYGINSETYDASNIETVLISVFSLSD